MFADDLSLYTESVTSSIIPLDPRCAPLRVITRFDVSPSLRHEIEEKVRIMDRK
jgi:hypothetical protein